MLHMLWPTNAVTQLVGGYVRNTSHVKPTDSEYCDHQYCQITTAMQRDTSTKYVVAIIENGSKLICAWTVGRIISYSGNQPRTDAASSDAVRRHHPRHAFPGWRADQNSRLPNCSTARSSQAIWPENIGAIGLLSDELVQIVIRTDGRAKLRPRWRSRCDGGKIEARRNNFASFYGYFVS